MNEITGSQITTLIIVLICCFVWVKGYFGYLDISLQKSEHRMREEIARSDGEVRLQSFKNSHDSLNKAVEKSIEAINLQTRLIAQMHEEIAVINDRLLAILENASGEKK